MAAVRQIPVVVTVETDFKCLLSLLVILSTALSLPVEIASCSIPDSRLPLPSSLCVLYDRFLSVFDSPCATDEMSSAISLLHSGCFLLLSNILIQPFHLPPHCTAIPYPSLLPSASCLLVLS